MPYCGIRICARFLSSPRPPSRNPHLLPWRHRNLRSGQSRPGLSRSGGATSRGPALLSWRHLSPGRVRGRRCTPRTIGADGHDCITSKRRSHLPAGSTCARRCGQRRPPRKMARGAPAAATVPPLSLARPLDDRLRRRRRRRGQRRTSRFQYVHFEPDFDLQTGVTNLGTAALIAARLQRWSRWSVGVAWGNGLTLDDPPLATAAKPRRRWAHGAPAGRPTSRSEARCASHRGRAPTPRGSTAARATAPRTTRSPSADRDSRWG